MRIETIDPGFAHWFAGFIDGEGCFYIRSHQPTRVGYGCLLRLQLRDDDRAILDEIRDILGVGTTGVVSVQAGESGMAYWVATSRRDCAALVCLFDRYPLRAKKARDYAIWREAVQEWCRLNPHRGPGGTNDWSRMAALRETLMGSRRYNATQAPPPVVPEPHAVLF